MITWALLVATAVLLGPSRRTPPRRPARRSGARGATSPHQAQGRVTIAVRRWWPLAPVATVVAIATSPLLALFVPVAVVAGRWWAVRLVRRRLDAARVASLPEVLELVAVAIRAGGTVAAALTLVAERGPAPADRAFAALLGRMGAGSSALDALDSLPVLLGEAYRPLSGALVSAERDGAPLASVVGQLASDAHEARRRAAEARARQVPVRLLLPLVCCTLPAVLIVTVVPLIVVGGGLPG
jgi:tight adherence protein C